MSTNQKIRLLGLARGAIAQWSDAPQAARGIARMIGNRPWRHQSIGGVVARHAARRGDAVALKWREGQWTYGELNSRANQVAHYLDQSGIGSGSVVALGIGNQPDTLAWIIGIAKLGGIAALLPSGQQGTALAHSLTVAKAELLVASSEMSPTLDAVDTSGIPKCHVGGARDGWLDVDLVLAGASCEEPAQLAKVRSEQPCYYIFTSGTTGMPKASVMSHYRFLASLSGLGDAVVRLKSGETLYCPLPLYHNNALTVSWGAALAAGAALAIVPKFSASRFWDDVRQFDAQAFCYIGELCRYLLAQPESPLEREHSVRVAVGNGLRAELWPEFKRRFGIERVAEFYGASEGNLAFVNAFNQDQTAGFCPLRYAVVEFDPEAAEPKRDAAGRMCRVASGEVGLMIGEVTGRARFDGYTDAKASESKLLRDCFKDGDCWFNSGDLVRDQGWRHIQFVDRLGDTFRWKGENVATTEVERALNSHACLSEAVVYGVEIEGADGRAGMAALVPSKTFDENHLDDLFEHLAERLPDYAIPVYLRMRSHVDATGTFKHRKTELKDEGFDTARFEDPVYVRDGRSYRRLA